MADTHVTIVGNLTDDPELRFTQNGAAVANFTVAVTARVKDGDQWKDGDTSFYRCSIWRDYAENVAESLRKGNRVIVTGALKMRSWETDDGQKRSVIEVAADEVGPSLKWATASVTRTGGNGGGSRSSGGRGNGGSQFADEPPF